MKASLRVASKTLAVALTVALIRPEALWAAETRGIAPVQSVPVAMGSLYGVTLQDINVRPGLVLAPGAAAFSMPAAAIPETPTQAMTPAAAVAARPILGVIDTLQAKGVSLNQPTTRAEAAQLEAAAQSLPPGAAKQTIIAMAQAVTAPAGAGVEASLGRAYEGSKAAAEPAALVVAGRPEGLLARMARWSFLPKGLRRVIGARAAAKVPAPDHQALQVPLEKLRWAPEDSALPSSTKDLAVTAAQIVGQDNALKSIHFGLTMPGKGYNLFVAGPEGSGRETAVRHALDAIAPKLPTPPDRVAVLNFEKPEEPLILDLPAGGAPRFAMAVGAFGKTLQSVLPQVLSQVGAAGKKLEEAFERKAQGRFEAVKRAAEKERLVGGKFGMTMVLARTDDGVEPVFPVTLIVEGKPKSFTKPEELDEAIAQGAFTREEWDQAVAEAATKEEPFRAQFDEAHEQNGKEFSEMREKLEGLMQSSVAQVVKGIGQQVLAVVAQGAHNTDTPEHKAWEARAKQRRAAFAAELERAKVGRFLIVLKQVGPMLVPVIAQAKEGGEPVALSKKDLDALAAKGDLTSDDLAKLMKHRARILALAETMQKLNSEEHEALHEAERAANPEQQRNSAKAAAYVEGLMKFAEENYAAFLPHKADPSNPMSFLRQAMDPTDLFRVSVLSSNQPGTGAPVLSATSHSIEELFGSAESNDKMVLVPGAGAVKTDRGGLPRMRTGLFQKANGGFLLLEDMKLLKAQGSFHAVMQAVDSGQAEIVEGGLVGLITGRGERYRVPSKVKVIIVGSPMIKALLSRHDDDFARNFNAPAQFEQTLDIGPETILGYLQFMKQVIVKGAGQIADAARDGISAVLEFAARLADSNEKVSAQFGQVHTLMREATAAAAASGSPEIRREHVEAALKARKDRDGLFQKHYLERMKERVFLVETEGAKVGQINGLAVMGDFGVPMRVTVSATAGRPGLVSVDRDAKMTGQSFEKALGVVEGFLQHTFAQKKAISAHIRISFEQSYGGIDGDSATSTEIYGSLSSLSGVAIAQGFAVTGSADQYGHVQAIGGVNEKIEGFFDLCVALGLTGKQGIIIPKSNVANLMLKPEVVQAVREGKFRIYAVDHVSQGIEILTGTPYSEILRKAEARLDALRGGAN